MYTPITYSLGGKISKIFFIIVPLFYVSCCALKDSNKSAFVLKEATYQSWFVNDNEKGTDIVLKLEQVLTDISFDSLVFKGVKVPVTVEKNGNRIYIIKGTIRSDLSILKSESNTVNEPNQLIYILKNKRYCYLLKNINRKDMKYY